MIRARIIFSVATLAFVLVAITPVSLSMQPDGANDTTGKTPDVKITTHDATKPQEHDGRTYYLHVPDDWLEQISGGSASDDLQKPAPPVLLVWLHPSGGNAKPEYDWLVRNRKKQIQDMVVLAPQAAGRGWSTRDDARFVDSVIEKIIQDYQLDADRTILGGHSAGAMFTYMYGLPRQERFFMIVPAAGRIHTRFVRVSPANCKSPYFHIYHSKNDQVVPFKHAKEAKAILEKRGYRVDLTTDKIQHNVGPKVLDIILDAEQYLQRTYLPKNVNNEVKSLLGGDDALTTLWQADKYDLRPTATANSHDAGLRRMRNVLHLLQDPATYDFDTAPRGEFTPGRTLTATKADATVTIQFSTAFDQLRIATGTTEKPGDLEAAKVTSIAHATRALMRRWIVPINCK